MKYRYILSFIVFFWGLCLNAQIQRSFLGCSLGKTTRTEVKKQFNSKGVKVLTDSPGDFVVARQEFAGIKWKEIHFMFINGTLYNVVFTNGNKDDKDGILKTLKDYLDKSLLEKYSAYSGKDKRNGKAFFYDGQTRVSTDYEYHNGNWILTLTYTDTQMLLGDMENHKKDL